MTTGLPDLPEGQKLDPGRRPWRRLLYVPLLLLAIVSIAALIVGLVVDRRIADQEGAPAPVESASSSSDVTAQTCRPPIATTGEPWWADAGKEATWAAHAEEMALPYFTGPNGWTFWGDQIDQYASQAVGRAYLSAADVDRWVEHLTSLRDGLAAAGIDFYVIVAPSTSSVYPEELPTWMQDLRGPTAIDQFMSAVGDLPVIDLRSSLIEQKSDDVHLFSWSNSHWTDFGANASWAQIAACVNELYPERDPLVVPEVSGAEIVGDFNEWASYGVPSPGADWSVPVYAQALQDVTRVSADGSSEVVAGQTVADASTLPVETTVSEPWSGASALIFRDSMGGGLSPLWQQAYSPAHQVWQPYRAGYEDPRTYADYVSEYQPEVVVVQLAERHLINTPPRSTGY